MNRKYINILAIETSCDETAAAVVQVILRHFDPLSAGKAQDRQIESIKVLSNVVSSQVDIHAKYGGVFPELASREHLKNILPVIDDALDKANKNIKNDIDYIAVTCGPGLVGSLLAGTVTAKTLASIFNKPVIKVNHLEGHIYSNFIREKSKIKDSTRQAQDRQKSKIKFPLMCLISSGGHTSLINILKHGDYQIVGETLDDAVGESYDKVANMLGYNYPGGPIIDKLASENNSKYEKKGLIFPRSLDKKDNLNFSFSGLKTAVLYYLKKYKKPYSMSLKRKVAYEFQEAATDSLVDKTILATKKYKASSVLLSGGVAANSRLHEKMKEKASIMKVGFYVPERKNCTDNAAMIGVAAAYKLFFSKPVKWYDIVASANAELK